MGKNGTKWYHLLTLSYTCHVAQPSDCPDAVLALDVDVLLELLEMRKMRMTGEKQPPRAL
jgi:hypothetical protein